MKITSVGDQVILFGCLTLGLIWMFSDFSLVTAGIVCVLLALLTLALATRN